MIIPEITILYAGLAALMLLPMTMNVVRVRTKYKIGIGTGRSDGMEGERELLTAVRIHGNFIEYTPFILFLILLLELSGQCASMIHILAGAFLVGRLFHVWALIKKPEGPTFQRVISMILTYVVLIVAGVLNVANALGYGWSCAI